MNTEVLEKNINCNIETSNLTGLNSADNKTNVQETQKKNLKYCHVCNKRLKIMTTYDCRCGYLFCATHRTPEYHNCTFDYVEHGNNKISTCLKKIDNEKISQF